MAISTAVDLGRVSAIVGYEIKASQAGIGATFLPQAIAVLAEASTSNQGTMPPTLSFTSAKEVGNAYGYGSNAYAIARILRPVSGDVLGGIPTIIHAVAEAAGATATVITKSITGTATKNVTHGMLINGRASLDSQPYTFAVALGDQKAEIAVKIADAVNSVIGCPLIATVDVSDNVVFTSAVKGASSIENNVQFYVNDDSAGMTYAEDSKVAGAGIPSIAAALALFGSTWYTHVVNGVSSDSTILDSLEAFNGDANSRNGRYLPTAFKPAIYYFGANEVNTLAAATAITDARKLEMTNSFCPAPNSKALSIEAAANMVLLYAPMSQNNPNEDPLENYYSDMPIGETAGEFSDSSKRDQLVKIGSSTAIINSGKYQVIDLVTTYHPENEVPTAVLFRWVRDLVGLDWNYRYMYMILEARYVTGKTIVPDTSRSTNTNTISPKRWKGILATQYAPILEQEALLADSEFLIDSLQVGIGESNPNRFETSFDAQRTGVARVLPTTNNTQFKFNI